MSSTPPLWHIDAVGGCPPHQSRFTLGANFSCTGASIRCGADQLPHGRTPCLGLPIGRTASPGSGSPRSDPEFNNPVRARGKDAPITNNAGTRQTPLDAEDRPKGMTALRRCRANSGDRHLPEKSPTHRTREGSPIGAFPSAKLAANQAHAETPSTRTRPCRRRSGCRRRCSRAPYQPDPAERDRTRAARQSAGVGAPRGEQRPFPPNLAEVQRPPPR